MLKNNPGRGSAISPAAVQTLLDSASSAADKGQAQWFGDAVDKAIKRAHKTIKNICWFQVVETRSDIEKGNVHYWQVPHCAGGLVESARNQRSRNQSRLRNPAAR